MTSLRFTPIASINGIVASARTTFETGKTKSLEWRRSQLKQIIKAVEENKDAITEALRADLRRPEFECVVAEAMTVSAEAKHALHHLDEWAAPTSVPTPPTLLPGSSWTQPEPLGVALIIGPWNFPVQLLLNPLVGAVAAGCCAVIKPSEVAPSCAALTAELVSRYLDGDAIKVVQGGVPETTELLATRFDQITYTGNGTVARVVMAAASKHLTPVLLELGGKCPVVVARDADLATAAKRIITGKLMNAGQVCLAPDYVLVERGAEDALLSALSATLAAWYGEDPQASTSLGRLVNVRHWDRVMGYLKDCGGTLVAGGKGDRGDLYIAPTIVSRPSPDCALMTEEVFGPVLSVLPVDSLEEATRFIARRPKPLALYVFSRSGSAASQVLRDTSSGAAAINECVIQIANCNLPFGGVGESGLGSYHGRAGFTTYSHTKAVYRPWAGIDMGKLRYPPYTPGQLKTVSTLMASMPAGLPQVGWRDVLIGGLVVAVGVLAAKLHAAAPGGA